MSVFSGLARVTTAPLTSITIRGRPSQAAAEASPPPSTPSPSLAAALASAAVNGTPMFAGPRAALGVLFAREARGRPFGHTPKKVLSAARRRLWGGEDCHALAESLCIDEVDL